MSSCDASVHGWLSVPEPVELLDCWLSDRCNTAPLSSKLLGASSSDDSDVCDSDAELHAN